MAVINGTAGADNLLGTVDADQINGLGGDDTINGGSRQALLPDIDVVDGGDGIDTLVVDASGESQSVQFGTGFSPRFTVRSTSNNFYLDAYNMEKVRFTGGAGNDIISTWDFGGTVNGGGGIDHWLVDLGNLFTNVTFTLGSTTAIAAAGITSILGIERITITTGSGNDTVTGGGQADTINTGEGDDTVNAGTRVSGSPDSDVVNGGADSDTLVVDASAESQAVQLGVSGSPTYNVRSDSGNFYVDAYSIEKVKFTGGSGNDTINTGSGGVTVNGGAGVDYWIADLGALQSDITFTLGTTTKITAAGLTAIAGIERLSLAAGGGDDTITGGAEGDSIYGGNGDDTLNARTRPVVGASDLLDGERGTDTLVVDASAETLAVQLGMSGSPTYNVRSDSGNFYVDAYNIEKVKFTGGSGDDTINTGSGGVTVNGGGGIDHWLADLGDLTSAVTFILGTTTRISAAGLTSITNVERMSIQTGGGADTITGGAQADTITTGNGDDTINARTRPAGGAVDVVNGERGIDTLVVDATGESGAVSLGINSSPSYTVRSDSGNYYVDAYSIEKVKFTGGSGDDTINTGSGGVTVNGGNGLDHWLADLSGLTAGITFALGTTTAISAAGLTAIASIERISLTTGSGDDTITGGNQADSISTGLGDDTIDARTRPNTDGAGVDVVVGGRGTDTLVVDASAESQSVFLGIGSSPSYNVRSVSGRFYIDAYEIEKVKFTGGNGADTIDTGRGGVTVDGGGGIDHWLADLGTLTTGVTFTLGTTTAIAEAGLTSIANIERLSITTGSGNDLITGGAQADTITTGLGDDTIDARTRPTTAGAGIDVVDGGRGFDTLVVDGSAETRPMQLTVSSSPSFLVRADSGKFYIDAYAVERVVFSSGTGADLANGAGGNDVLSTGGGYDTLTGGDGDDTLDGGLGNDYLYGGRGIDSLTGGGGADVFDYNAVTESGVANGKIDTIADFLSGTDKIDLSAIDANNRAFDGDQAFTLIGGGFTGVAGQLRSVGGTIEGDVNGDGIADFRILLGNGAAALAADLIL